MLSYVQATLGNFSFFAAAWILFFNLPKRKLFWLRSCLCFILFCGWRYLYSDLFLSVFSTNARLGMNMFGYVILLGLLSAFIAVCFKCNFWTALFGGNAGYCVQHVCWRTYYIFRRLCLENAHAALCVLSLALIILLILGLLYFVTRKLHIDKIIVENKLLFATSFLLVGLIIVLDLFSVQALKTNSRSIEYFVLLFSLISAVLIFVLQFSFVTIKRTTLERDALKGIMEQAKEQYAFEKSIIDMVNVKFHDLKHQLSYASESEKQKLNEEASAIAEAYDSNFQTGNVALDVILTRKNFTCKQKDIELTCYVAKDGMSFMSETDVYSLFGNILDNAIEATEKIAEKEKRVISLSIEQRDNFVFIHAENYYQGKIHFEDGIPQTTKGDTNFHGFGMKSIRLLIQRYNGSMRINTFEDRFLLDILFPEC